MKIYIGVGATAAQELPLHVLAHTIRKHNVEHEIIIEDVGSTPEFEAISEQIENTYGTVFSLQRFLVPKIAQRYQAEICMHLDSDMLCMKSLQPFFDLVTQNKDKIVVPLPNVNFGQSQQTAVFGCTVNEEAIELFAENLQMFSSRKISYIELMQLSFSEQKMLPCSYIYNSREFFDDKTVILHLTDLYRQPWVNRFNELEYVWFKELSEAIKQEPSLMECLRKGVENRYYLQSLLTYSNRKHILMSLRDLLFLPPQFDAYAQQKFGTIYKSKMRLILKPTVTFWVQMVAIWHAFINYRKV